MPLSQHISACQSTVLSLSLCPSSVCQSVSLVSPFFHVRLCACILLLSICACLPIALSCLSLFVSVCPCVSLSVHVSASSPGWMLAYLRPFCLFCLSWSPVCIGHLRASTNTVRRRAAKSQGSHTPSQGRRTAATCTIGAKNRARRAVNAFPI